MIYSIISLKRCPFIKHLGVGKISNIMVSTTDANQASFTHTVASNQTTTAYIYELKEYDLSSFIGQNIFVAIQAVGANQYGLYVDDVSGPEIFPELPGVPQLISPVNASTFQSTSPTFTWIPTSGGVVQGYKVYLNTFDPPTTEVADVNTTSFTMTSELEPNTTYY